MMNRLELLHTFKQKMQVHEQKVEGKNPKRLIYQLDCKTYGFDCGFITIGDIATVIHDFKTHTKEEHYIDYPEGVLMKFITRKCHNL